MKNFRKILLFLLISCFTLSVFVGCKQSAKPKTFEKAGMKITLTTDFYEKELLSQTAYYESTNAIVTAVKEELSFFPSHFTVALYAQAVVANNQINVSVNLLGDMAYFTYEKTVSGHDFFYYATCHKSSDAFWLIQFACELDDKEDLMPTFEEYVASIEFVSDTPVNSSTL